MKKARLALFFATALWVFMSPAGAQIKPSGSSFTPGHTTRVMNPQGTVLGDAGGAAGSKLPGQNYLTEIGVTNTGTPFCINDALTNATGGYHALCLGANSSGGGLISFNAFGGAAPLPLSFNVNGTNYPFPFVMTGIVGPPTSTVNDVACWNNTTGTLLKDCGPPVALLLNPPVSSPMTADSFVVNANTNSGITGQNIYNQAVMSGSATLFNGFDAVRGVITAPSGSTVNTITGVAGYTINNTVPVGQRSQTVSLFGVGVCAVDNSNCWGINTLVSDNPSLANTGVTTGAGKFLTNEFDLNVSSPNSSGNGLAIGGTAWPQNTQLNINALAVTKLWGLGGSGTGTTVFANGLILADACCATGIAIGASALAGTNKTGMPMVFNYKDNSGVEQNETLTSAFGTLTLGGSSTYGLQIADGTNGLNAIHIGALAGAGANIASQYMLWKYLDASAVIQNYNMQVNAARVFTFGSSVGNAVAAFDFEGSLAVNSTFGATCTSGLGPTSRTVNGLVTAC